MICLKRTGRNSIDLYIDLNGINEFFSTLRDVMSNGRASMEVIFDYSIISRKRSAKCLQSNILIQKCESKDGSEMSKIGETIVWDFTGEELDYAVHYLNEAKKRGNFYPAEFLQIKTPKSEKMPGGRISLDWVYCFPYSTDITG
jgi:hypothetical protein